jgi:hypothetical protein
MLHVYFARVMQRWRRIGLRHIKFCPLDYFKVAIQIANVSERNLRPSDGIRADATSNVAAAPYFASAVAPSAAIRSTARRNAPSTVTAKL